MAPSFDPYHKWLGIPPDEQPPNHYRLLGIRDFEADPDVIQSAADQRMAHLRTYQTGRYADWSQRLLNEVAAAKICLLTPAKKVAYDQDLQTRSERRLPVATFIGALFAVAAVAAAGLAYWGLGSRERPATVARLSGPSADRDHTSNAALRNGANSPLKKRATAGLSSSAGEKLPENAAGQAASGARIHGNQLFQQAAKAPKKGLVGNPVAESWPADRVVLPTAAAQEEAMNLARDLYQADLAKAKTAEEKRALAGTLLAEAKAAKSVDVSTLVLLRLARDTAAETFDVATAFAAIDAMAARYRIDPWEMKRATFSTCAQTARTPAQHLALAEQAERLRDELAAAGASAQAAAMATLAATEREAAAVAKP